MRQRLQVFFMILGTVPSLGAAYRTTNFAVEAPTAAIARQVAEVAEVQRRELARAWLDTELSAWAEPCQIRVRLTIGSPGGNSTFSFEGARATRQTISLEGPLDKILTCVLPHELTHILFANHFGRPVPRWADEGGAVLAESSANQGQHDAIAKEVLGTPGRPIPLRRLLALRDYPGDVTALYSEGYSLAKFLVNTGGRSAFLGFVGQGMRADWDTAVQVHYGYRSVEELERAWLRGRQPSGIPVARLIWRSVTEAMTEVAAPPRSLAAVQLQQPASLSHGVRSILLLLTLRSEKD